MQTLNRVAACTAARDGESLMVDASLASDVPYRREGYSEILDCRPGAVNLSRAKDGLPLLMHHDRTLIVGRVHGIRADGRRLRGKLKFFDTTAGREAEAMISAGHRELSVGYTIDEAEKNQAGDLVATRWTLLEASIVAIPADAGIGVSRSLNMNQQDQTPGANAADVLTRNQRRQAGRSEQDESERVQKILAIGAAYKEWVKPSDITRAVREGHSVDQFNDLVLDNAQTPPMDVTSPYSAAIISQRGDPQDFTRGYSLERALMSAIDPAGYLRTAGREKEISQELSRSSPLQSAGLMVPFGAFLPSPTGRRDMSAGVPGYGGSFVQTTVAQQMIDAVRARSVVVGLGAQVLPGLTGPVDLPRKSTTTTTSAWLAEIQESDETEVGTDAVSLAPKRIGAWVELSRQLMITSSVPMEQMIQNDLRMSLMAELDRVALLGTGASNQPRGVKYTPAIGSVVGGTNGATLAWQHILELEAAVEGNNGVFDPQSTGYVINGATRSYLKRTPRHPTLAEGLIMGDAPNDANGFNVLNGYRAGVSSKVPSNLVKGTSGSVCSLLAYGDWSQLVVALFGGGVEIIVDPYSRAKTGTILINANLFADIGVRVPLSFATMEDAKLV